MIYVTIKWIYESKENIKYKFHWFINGIQIPQTQRIIKFKSKPNFSVKCIINTSDGRTSEFYKKIIVNSLEFKDSVNEIKDSLNFESNINLSEKTNIKEEIKQETKEEIKEVLKDSSNSINLDDKDKLIEWTSKMFKLN